MSKEWIEHTAAKFFLASNWKKNRFVHSSTGVDQEHIVASIQFVAACGEEDMLLIIILLLLIFGFGYGGYRVGPGWGYYGGGGIGLILTIVLILVLLRVF
jgi:hypothetical protein